MASFTVLSNTRPGDTPEEAAARVVFVRDSFSWWGLLFPLVVLLRYGLWWAFLAFLAVSVILGFLNGYADLSEDVTAAVTVGFSVLVGLELSAMRVRKLISRGYREEGVVVAGSLDEAETRFFAGWTPDTKPVLRLEPTASPLPVGAHTPAYGIIGSLPESARR